MTGLQEEETSMSFFFSKNKKQVDASQADFVQSPYPFHSKRHFLNVDWLLQENATY
jgi:hypothetical protein